jgi:hypothetical protein
VNPSRKNYKDYIKGKSRLKNAVLQHPAGENKIMNLLNKEIKRDFWVIPFSDWQKIAKRK